MYDDIGAVGASNFSVDLDGTTRLAEMNRGVTPLFAVHPIQNDAKSKEAGRPIFDNVEICTLLVAGDPYNQVSHPADSEYIQNRFPEQYKKWKQNKQERTIDGTPLRAWPLLSAANVAEFEALNIYNVEGLAAIPETTIGKIMGLREWRAKAQAWLAAAKDSAVVTKLAAENDSMRDQLRDLAEKVNELTAQLQHAQTQALKAKK
jgi:hypothetical protein